MPKAINHQFPHLRDFEVALWLRFLAKFPDRFDFIGYDFRVGQGLDPPVEFTPNLKKMTADLTKKRIDAVGGRAGVQTLIEIAPNADANHLGKLLVYRDLWQQEHPGEPTPELMLVTDFARSDISESAGRSGVEVVVV